MAEPLPWWADPTNPRNMWASDYSRSYNPQGYTSPDDPNYRYQNWLQQNFDVSQFAPQSLPVQTQYGGEEYTRPTAQNPTPTPTATAATPSPTVGTDRPTVTTANAQGNPSPTTPPTGNQWDGFARRYNDVAQDLLFSQYGPQIILDDYLGQDGMKNRPNLSGDLARYAQSAPMIYDILMAGNLDPEVTGDDDVINWMAKMFGDMTSPGGRAPDTALLWRQMMAGLQNEDSNLYAKTMLGADGNPATTQQQISAINQLIPLLTTYTGNYNYVDGVQRQAKRLGQEYAQMIANGANTSQTYADYLQQNFLR